MQCSSGRMCIGRFRRRRRCWGSACASASHVEAEAHVSALVQRQWVAMCRAQRCIGDAKGNMRMQAAICVWLKEGTGTSSSSDVAMQAWPWRRLMEHVGARCQQVVHLHRRDTAWDGRGVGVKEWQDGSGEQHVPGPVRRHSSWAIRLHCWQAEGACMHCVAFILQGQAIQCCGIMQCGRPCHTHLSSGAMLSTGAARRTSPACVRGHG